MGEGRTRAPSPDIPANPNLLTDLLTTDLDGHGRGWSRFPDTCPASRSNRSPWMMLNVPDLATDLKVPGPRVGPTVALERQGARV